jgi:YD repeat-containing protein
VDGSTKTEYDPAGRWITLRWLSNPQSDISETIQTRTYDGSGRLLTETKRTGGVVLDEKAYSYDDKGRLLRIVESSGDDRSFQYDENGRKVEIRDIAQKADEREAVAIGMDVMFADVEENFVSGLGETRNASRLKTIYDEHDQPTETQALGPDDHLLSRTVRTYDEKQRIIDVQDIIEDPMVMFSAKQQADMVAPPGFSLDEMKAELMRTFRSMMGKSGKSCAYDSQGRRTKVVLYLAAMGEATRTYSYNDHGDVIEERTIHTKNPKIPVGVIFRSDESGNLVPEKPPSEWPPQPELPESIVRYKYQYDSFGNWTEQTQTRSEGSRPEGWEYTTRRELTYY